MYITSKYAGWGRNFWAKVDNGTVTAYNKGEQLHVRVENGIVVEQTRRTNGECTTLRYGQGSRCTKANKKVKEEYFQPGTLQAIRRGGLWKRETAIPFCGTKGTVECFSSSGGAFGKERFTYDNGNLAYIASRWRKKLCIKRPDGKLWIVIEGMLRLNRRPIAEKLDTSADDLGLWYLMRGQNWSVTIYDTDGAAIVTQGRVENRQKHGKWLEKGKTVYYLSGIKVSRNLYEENPDKWDGYEVLKVPNAQLRCSLLSRMGYDRLIEKVRPRIIESSADGGELLEIDTPATGNNHRGIDKILRMIKVICPSTGQSYVLRVPPAIDSFEQARQWTFGLREESIQEGAILELAKET